MTLTLKQAIGYSDTSGFVLGGDVSMLVQIADAHSNAPASNVSGTTAASAQFGNADGTVLTKTLGAGVALVDAVNALFSVRLTPTESAALMYGAAQSWQFAYIGGDGFKTVVAFEYALELTPQVF